MAQATRKTDVAGRRIAKKGEPRLARYAEKEVTPVINLYGDWLEEEVFGSPLSERDRQILFVGSALRGAFQKSDTNQNRIASRKDEIADEAEARAARAEERAAKREAREAARAERAAAPKKSAPEKTSAKTASKSAPTKSAPAKAGTTRRRPATSKSSDDF